MRDIPRFRLVWVAIPAGVGIGSVIKFDDVPQLRERKVIAIEAYDAGLLAATPDQVAVITQTDAPSVSVTFNDDNDERLKDFPVPTLMPTYNAGIYKQVEPFVINWQSSFVRINAAVTGPVSMPFGIFYI